MRVGVQAIGASRSQVRRLPDLDGCASAARLARLREGGLDQFHVTEGDVFDMAAEAASDALEQAGLAPEALDGLLVVSESLWDAASAEGPAHHIAFRDRMLRRLVLEGRISNAAAAMQWSSACGNFAPALQAARALVVSGQCERVLLILADRVAPGASRIIENGGGVLSDVAAAVLLGPDHSTLELKHIVLRPSPEVLQPRTEANFVLQAKALRNAIQGLDDKCLRETGARLAEFDWLVVESFASPMIQFFCELIGADRDRVLSPGTDGHGHAFSADLPLSLRDPRVVAKLRPGDRLGAVSLSSWLLSVAVFDTVVLPTSSGQVSATDLGESR